MWHQSKVFDLFSQMDQGSYIVYQYASLINLFISLLFLPLEEPFSTVMEVTIGFHFCREPVLQVQLSEFILNSLSQMSLNTRWMLKWH